MNPDILILIKAVLIKHLPKDEYEFFLYWSRARWDYDLRSDYDIWILWKNKVKFPILSSIKNDFERIPTLIDLTDFNNVSEFFKKRKLWKI